MPAAALYAERRYAEAVNAYTSECKAHPHDPNVWLGRGQSLLALGRWSDAWAALQQARTLVADKRGRAIVDARRAEAAAGMGDATLAEACFRASLAERPDPTTRGRLGTLLLNQSRLDEAETELVAAGGALPEVAASLATLRTQRGDAEGALDALRKAPDDPAVALARARACVQLRRAAEALPGVDAALRRAAPAQAALLHHARATLLDQLGDYAGAAASYTTMHTLRGDRVDPDAILARAHSIVETWRPTAAPPAPAGAPRPVFLVGLPRSGTSLCEQSLAAHPEVDAKGEREELRQLTQRLGPALGAPWPTCTPDVPRAAASAAKVWRDAVGGTRAVVIDKMPENLFRLGFASQLFPDAVAIWMRRGLMDTLLSCWQQAFGPGQAWAGTFEGLAAQAMAYEIVGRRWLEAAPMPMCVITYEELVREPARELADILTTLGLPWDDAVLAPERVERTVRTASILQVRQSIHTGSIGRWRRYEAELAPLRALIEGYGLEVE